MARVGRRVFINDDDYYEIVQKLRAEPLFNKLELTEFFAIALIYGKKKGYRTQLVGKKTGRIKEDTLNNSILPYLMMAIAVEETGSFEILAEEKDYFEICQEYAKTGVYALEEDYNNNPKGLLSNLELEALKFFDSAIMKDLEEKSKLK